MKDMLSSHPVFLSTLPGDGTTPQRVAKRIDGKMAGYLSKSHAPKDMNK
jgi:hypothetical protein